MATNRNLFVGVLAGLLVLSFSGSTQAGGAYPWGSAAFDCSDDLLCAIWDGVDPQAPRVQFANPGELPGGCSPTETGYTCIERYESQALGDHLVVGLLNSQRAADGTYNYGGVFWDGLESGYHATNGGGAALDLPEGLWKVRVTIIDDSGERIGAFFCTDGDGNDLCSEAEGELAQGLCGESLIFKPMDTAAISRAVVYVDGPNFQLMDCPGSTHPTGGTSGLIRLDLTYVS